MAKKVTYSKRDIKDINIILGVNLKAARENAGMTQTDVMRAIWGVSNNRNRISEIENGKKDLTLLDLLTFQKLYGQSLDYICGLSVEPEIDMMAGTVNNMVGVCRNMIELLVGDMASSMVEHVKSISRSDHEALLYQTRKLCETVRSEDKLDRAAPAIVRETNQVINVITDIEAKLARQVKAVDTQMTQIQNRHSKNDRHRLLCDRNQMYQYSFPMINPDYINPPIEDAYIVGGYCDE